ncbi:MAG: hypothetical protein K9M99_03435 [Candidatus Cloacimonetes bacterium]|nr:hypothetical protein [Candidatus Cloacimonadota bacterium]
MKNNAQGIIIEISRERALILIDKAARFFVERKLTPAALMTIESLRPLNFIGSQIMYMIMPFAELFFNSKQFQEFAVLMEDDEYIKILLERIDELDTEIWREERKLAQLKRKKRKENFHKFIKKIFKK